MKVTRASMVVLEELQGKPIENGEPGHQLSPSQSARINRLRKRAVRRHIQNSDMMMERDNLNLAKERVLINVGGVKHETYRSTLKMIPDTRLAWIAENKSSNFEGFDATKNEYFFDRHPGVFIQILNYYRTGKLHSPSDVCGPLFEEELQFWGIDEKQMEPCCWAKYTEHRDAQANLKVFEDGPPNADDDAVPAGLPAYLTMEEVSPRQKSAIASCFESFITKVKPSYFESSNWKMHKRKMFTLIEDHRSSLAAKVWTSFSLFFIIVSVISIFMHSILQYKFEKNSEFAKTMFLVVRIMDLICFTWFLFEIIVRILVYHPTRKRFFVSVINWIDVISMLTFIPQFIYLALKNDGKLSDEIEMIAAFRLFRLFRFFRLSSGLEVLKHTMIASSKEIILLLMMLMIPVTLFATIVHFCERQDPSTKFKTIPESLWWAIVTMTTVGYGDMAPKTTFGKAFGAFCASCSLLILALPVSIIGNNFSLFYSYAQARLKLPKKSHNALVGAANVLMADTNSSHSPDLDGSEEENGSGSDDNNSGAGEANLSVAKRYRRDRHSLYAGGVVRNSRRVLRSRSTGVTGLSSDSEKEQRDSLTRTSNITGTTEAESPVDNQKEADEKEQNQTQSSDSNVEQKCDGHTKPNGSIAEKPPSGRRRNRSGGQRIHPVIKLQVTEDGDDTRSDGRGLDNETFDNRLDTIRTPPMNEVEYFGSVSQIKNNSDIEKSSSAETLNKKQLMPQNYKNVNRNDTREQNGTLLQTMIPESRTEVNCNDETSVDNNDIDYDRVSFR
ncbi:potassium voltage-gated channel protein Shaw-like isoform X3 [Rhopilema esculentum]|uniref:potassium voltage-gated channel protein Shaw-like isoform X3 n=1 Tax=Rhopilema esculentum TaxID=499914 RepID=UPI0031DFD249